MKPIAIFFSDLHLGEYVKFNKDNKRTLSHFKVLFNIRKICLKYNIPAICPGDLFHKPEVISNQFFANCVDQFKKLDSKKWECYTISGNHDMGSRNSKDSQSSSWVSSFSKVYGFIKLLDWETIELEKFTISGIPYLDNNIDLNKHIKELGDKGIKNHILVLHTDYPGACDTDGTEVREVQNLNINLLSPFKLVTIGHIHKPQKLGKKVYMVGAPLQQRRTDRDCELGYWLLMEDFSFKFIPVDKFPKFIDVSTPEEVKDDGNYYTVIPTIKEETVVNHKITKDTSKSKLVRRYMKATKNDDKEKRRILTTILNKTDAGIQ